eukprot:g5958.t1
METARIIFRNPYVTREGDALPDWKKELPLSFTIKKVKAFLEKEYPGKPFACDIRLVFSGKMLSDDTLSLRKILENEDLSSWHTFHLIASRTGFSPSVSPAEKKIPSDLSPLRGNTPDSVEEEEKNNLSTVTDNNSIKPHLTSNTNSSINVENQTTSTSSRIVGSDGASNNVSSRNNNTFPGQVQHSTSNVAPMLQRHPLAPTHIGLLHFIARTVTCGRYGNRNNNDNNNDNNANNGNGGNLMEENVNIPTPPVGNIPNPVQSVGFFCDLKCFVISFVFSLYPTWYPVAIPSPTPPTPVVAEEVNNNVEQEVNDENNNIQEAINHAQPEGIAQN